MEKTHLPTVDDGRGLQKHGRAKRLVGVLFILCAAAVAVALWKVGPLLRTATGSVSLSVANGVFVSGLDPAQVYREEQLPNPGMSTLAWALRYTVDCERKEVRTTILGGFASRAVYQEGYGCHLVQPTSPPGIDWAASDASETAALEKAPPLVEAIDPRLSPALDAAFAEVDERKLRQTKAVVVLHDGKLVAERYAPGYGADTPIWGHSLTKSVTSALVGILVREGKRKSDQPAAVPVWRSADDPRRAVTVDHLLRMDEGLPPDETDDIFTLATRMWFLEPDSVAFVSRQKLAAPPGTRWAYGNLPYALLSGMVREAAGGEPRQTLTFVRRELFEPLGMRHSTLEFDSAGTPMGNGFMYASARDWARFGQLYLDDGVVGDRRILPEGWVKHCTTPTLDTGYGAGWWTNRKTDGEIPYWGIPWGLPELPDDTYFGRGAMGQFLVVVPSAHLVVVRLGMTHDTNPGIRKLASSVLGVFSPAPVDPPSQ